MKTLKDLQIKNKTVLLRADLDISDGDDFRLEAAVPTIKYLLDNQCKIIIIGHMGRPEGKPSDELSLFPIFEKLKTYFPEKDEDEFKFISSILSGETKEIIGQAKFEDIIMLENLRFYTVEESNDAGFAEYLASLADVYVNDAFAVCHREHASIVGIPKFLPSCAGLHLEKEIDVLSKVMKNPEHPAVAIIGGAKIETKIPVISEMAKSYDKVLVGGKLGIEDNYELRITNYESTPLCHPEERGAERNSDEGSRRLQNKTQNVLLPVDYIGNNKFDIGDKTIEQYKEIIAKAKTVVWNGPMGKFEDENFVHGTKEIACAIIESQARSIIGGGDTIAAISKLGIPFEKFSWVSTGGGAMLEFMAGDKLAGIEVLEK